MKGQKKMDRLNKSLDPALKLERKRICMYESNTLYKNAFHAKAALIFSKKLVFFA